MWAAYLLGTKPSIFEPTPEQLCSDVQQTFQWSQALRFLERTRALAPSCLLTRLSRPIYWSRGMRGEPMQKGRFYLRVLLIAGAMALAPSAVSYSQAGVDATSVNARVTAIVADIDSRTNNAANQD